VDSITVCLIVSEVYHMHQDFVHHLSGSPRMGSPSFRVKVGEN
jgi:hypothetical protein